MNMTIKAVPFKSRAHNAGKIGSPDLHNNVSLWAKKLKYMVVLGRVLWKTGMIVFVSDGHPPHKMQILKLKWSRL
jgi:hypothetical protein